MEYTKVKVLSKDDPKRFYRVLAIKGDPDLYELGAIIGFSVQAWFEHMYLFNKKGQPYIPDMWMEDFWEDAIPMSKSHLSDLGNSFTFEYDTGEGWEFDCRVMKRKIQYHTDSDEYPFAFVVEGKGQGIFENDHYTFWRFLNGEIDPNSSQEDENIGQFLPMNMDFETYGDFDSPLDLEKFIFMEEDIYKISKQFPETYDDINYENEEPDEEDFEYTLLLNQIAGLIFNEEFTNQIFRNLIKKYDINEAYDMIVKCFMDSMSELDEDEDPEVVHNYICERLKTLD